MDEDLFSVFEDKSSVKASASKNAKPKQEVTEEE